VAGPDHEVRVFARRERADAVVDFELDSGVERDELECLFFGDAAVLYGFGSLGIEPACEFI